MTVEDVRRIKSTEMRMLRMICGNTVKDKVRNEEIRERTEVETIKEHLGEQYFHIERMDRERSQSVTINFKIDCSKNQKRGGRS